MSTQTTQPTADEPLTLKVLDPKGNPIGVLYATPKTFSTGSRGFHANGKVQLNSKDRLQVSASLVIIGSKKAAK